MTAIIILTMFQEITIFLLIIGIVIVMSILFSINKSDKIKSKPTYWYGDESGKEVRRMYRREGIR